MQGFGFDPWLGELRSYIPPGQKKKNQNTKQKQYCNKSNKDFKKKKKSHDFSPQEAYILGKEVKS